ncbi:MULTISPECIES: hypothetical protein [unclassified Sphingomonas]|uniref:hypothetical protein n=1 Tax=unclassified Sphingomonas TaxID=196159 RepID=UPI000AE8D035|nr:MULTISPECIES: hypothetical protein [unclassified Sphingomonas]
MPNDTDLTNRLTALLLETAQNFLRIAQEQRQDRGYPAEYEISLAVRRRTLSVPSSG